MLKHHLTRPYCMDFTLWEALIVEYTDNYTVSGITNRAESASFRDRFKKPGPDRMPVPTALSILSCNMAGLRAI